MLRQLKLALAETVVAGEEGSITANRIPDDATSDPINVPTDDDGVRSPRVRSRHLGAISSRRVSARRNELGGDGTGQMTESEGSPTLSTSHQRQEDQTRLHNTEDNDPDSNMDTQSDAELAPKRKWRNRQERKKAVRREKSYIPATRPWSDPNELTRDEIKIELKKRNYLVRTCD